MRKMAQYPECDCYVRFLSEAVKYTILFGAHNPACPVYRECSDKIDRKYAEEFRHETEKVANTFRHA